MPVDLRANAGNDEGCLAKINWTLRNFNLADLTDYYKNPRSLSEKEFKQLKTSLDKFGMIDKPIVNLDADNTIIGGHQRKHVLEASGVKECECWVPDRELSEKEVEELNIRLNKNTGSWDFDTLANEFELPDLLEWGFSESNLISYSFDPEMLTDAFSSEIGRQSEYGIVSLTLKKKDCELLKKKIDEQGMELVVKKIMEVICA